MSVLENLPTESLLPAAALDAAVQLFWERGYQGTSVEELVARTGLHRAGLYAACGGKRRLYEAALRRYRARVLGAEMEPIEPLDASFEAVRRYLERLGERALGPEGRLGCLLALAVSEPLPLPAGVARIVEECRGELRSRLARALRNAQLRGEARAEVEVGAAADLVAGARLGLMVLARSPAPRQAVRHCADGIVGLLDRIR